MTYGYSREFSDEGVSFDFRYDLTTVDLPQSTIELEGYIQVNFGEQWSEPRMISMESSDNLTIETQEPTIESSEATSYLRKSEFIGYLAGRDSTERITLEFEDEDGRSWTLSPKLPASKDLQLVKSLISGSPPAFAAKDFGDRYDEDLFKSFGLLERASYALDIHGFFQLANFIAAEVPPFRSEFRQDIYNTFKNLVANRGLGRFISIRTYGDFRDALAAYNEQSNLIKFPHDSFFRYLVDEGVIDKQNGGIQWFVEQLSDEDFRIEDIPDQEFAIIAGSIVSLIDVDKLVDIVSNRSNSTVEWDEFTERVEDAKQIEYWGDRSRQFRLLLYDAVIFSDDSFKYILANFLFWQLKAIQRSGDRRRTTVFLADICTEISTDTSFEFFAERAEYEGSLAQGRLLRRDNPDEAIEYFRKAVRIAGDDTGQWTGSRYHHLLPPLREQIWLEAEQLRDTSQYRAAKELLDKRIKLIEDLEDIDTGSKEYTEGLFRGFRHEIEGSEFLDNQRFQQALEAFDRAAGAYKQVNREGLFEGIVGRKYQIKALLAEVEGSFSEAADLHEKYTDVLPDSKGARFHHGRKHLCRAKMKLLAGDEQAASKEISQIRQNASRLMPDEERFQLLINATIDYRAGKTSEITRFVDGLLSGMDDSVQRLVDFSDDYVTGFLTVLAAQRLNNLPIADTLLDELVNLALEEACFPNSVMEISPDELNVSQTLANISVETDWQLSLPSHVLDHLEQVRTTRQTTFGDFSGLVRDLIVPLEQHLAILVEYHAQKFWGKNWQDHIETEPPFSVGDYLHFFNTEASEQLSIRQEVRSMVDTGIIGDKPVTQLRNALDHGRNPQVSQDPEAVISEEQFEFLYDRVMNLMRVSMQETPVLGEVESKFGNEAYRIRLHWNDVIKRTWITTQKNLESTQLYYFPQEAIDKEMVDVPKSDVIVCKEERARSFLLDE